MSDGKSSLRIDWFDGTLIEEAVPNAAASASEFADEDQPEPQASTKIVEKKPIGFKRLLNLSLLKPPNLTVEIAYRPGFWNLMDEELKGDYIVLIVKILANIYKSLEPGEKSKIVSMLENRFEKSNFLEILKEYLIGLPSVRVVEKRLNSYLWDDAQSFYFEVLSLCKGIFDFGGNSEEYLKNINDLLEILETSALGVREEHTETFNNSLFEQIVELRSKIMETINKESNNISKTASDKTIDKNSFKYLSIFPTKEDLLYENKILIQPNIINGAYPNIESYLDLQFKLLREDCFGPLRDGICKYMANSSKRRHENIRVHPKVRIIRTYIANNKVGHLVDIAWNERVTHGLVDSKKYAYSKQLMFGSLLLFTCDNFDTILCATVLDSSLALLTEGYVAVQFQNPVSNKIFSEPNLMVESEVFFEPYHRVLKVMQNSGLDDLPMRKYIVDVQKETQPPSYLTPETMYTITEPRKSEEISFPVLDTAKWPLSSFGLDESQTEAFSFALKREFAVIQGPPGTGKTFLGVKIASTLLKNLSLEGTPMLIICYTNHALDQFLEGILEVTTNVVRLGSQSKSKILEPYNLSNLRTKMKSKYSYIYGSKKAELEKIFIQMTDLQTEMEKCEKEIITYKTIKPYLKSKIELKSNKEDPILSWLFNHLEDKIESMLDDNDSDDWEKQLDELQVGEEKIETCFSAEWALKEIASMHNSIKYIKDVVDDHSEGQKMAAKFETQILKVRKRLNYFKKNIALLQKEDEEDVLAEVKDLNSLKPEQRWRTYAAAVRTIKNGLMVKMNNLMVQHNSCSQELEEVATLTDGEVMKSARVVGVTTTTAARRHDLMKKLHSSIVIVEEAAEVMEAHIVASLTHQCQHLILIGDHKQLRPSASHYKLAKHYNLEISLFERMVNNDVHSRTLSVQRRMRREFVDLLVPSIYERLDCHPSVDEYEHVRGMTNDLYFLCHDVLEDSEGLEDSWSHKNTLEAKWCVSLANYLRQMNYNPEEITILATYTGQATLIKELSKKYPLLRGMKITVVDNYQGEENRIVILSLVRSNREGKIGFLSAANRICVALSRAKEGFYIFGNMNLLKSASSMWRFINDQLVSKNAIGKKFTLCCDIHKENYFEEPMTSVSEYKTKAVDLNSSKNMLLHASFKNLSIFPKKEDLLYENNVLIKPNIVNGAYPSVEYYLDLQFKLFREDCFGPLREGICEYKANPSKKKHENIRVHPTVHIIHTYLKNNKIGHLVDIAWDERSTNGSVDSKKYAHSKQLMLGSLLLFTCDNFDTVLCATVLDYSLLDDGYLAVQFQNPVSNKIFSEPYLMVESQVYFEPYHRVLKVMQNSGLDDLPMRRYIVDVQKETQAPAYLKSEKQYTIIEPNKSKPLRFPVLATANCLTSPLSSFGLEKSQMEAYIFALTREFAVIQGPPGTGKTYLGVKIASTLLRNWCLKGTPMLIICFKNHALDQFLEGILDVTTDVVRLGGQSKSEKLKPYNLNSMKTKMKSKYSYQYATKKVEMENIFKQLTDVQTEIEKCEEEILSYKTVKPYLKTKELISNKEDPILSWLFNHLDNEMETLKDSYPKRQIEQFQQNVRSDDKLETCFSAKWALNEIDAMNILKKDIKNVIANHFDRLKIADKAEKQILKLRKRLNCFQKNIALLKNVDEENTIAEVRNLSIVTPEQRWWTYAAAVRTIKNGLLIKRNQLLEKHNACSQELEEVATLTDYEVMKTATVVGVTTTIAARRHDLMKKLRSPIVIVEEAAEVMEAHIVASLTHQCQHLILIGDHKQLRPSASHYKLAKHYNLEISLFERMVNNDVHSRTLSVQRRMRREFVDLLVPSIYERLDCHPSVDEYKHVRGMQNDLYFLCHNVLEDSEGLEDSTSHKNTLEAKWCVSLANYLRQMNYDPEEITILTTYTGQATVIKELASKYALLQGVKITQVDSYQGEENRIIILSLVRSNREGKIGFLSESNRICVALSRAKEGFYIIGNMKLLKSASSLWRFINGQLVTKKAISEKLTVRCDTHKNTLELETPEDLDTCLRGSCLKTCPKEQTNTLALLWSRTLTIYFFFFPGSVAVAHKHKRVKEILLGLGCLFLIYTYFF